MSINVKLVKWETPFSTSFYPGISAVQSPECSNSLMVAVYGNQGNNYLLRVKYCAAYRCEDESVAPTAFWYSIPNDQKAGCTFILENSPWLVDFSEMGEVIEVYYGKLQHFVIFGGNQTIEFLASEKPEIEKLEEECLTVTYSFETTSLKRNKAVETLNESESKLS